MNSDRAAGVWKQLKGKVKEKWGKLTDDEIDQLEGKGDQLAGKLQERYGMQRDEAERQAREFRTRHQFEAYFGMVARQSAKRRQQTNQIAERAGENNQSSHLVLIQPR